MTFLVFSVVGAVCLITLLAKPAYGGREKAPIKTGDSVYNTLKPGNSRLYCTCVQLDNKHIPVRKLMIIIVIIIAG